MTALLLAMFLSAAATRLLLRHGSRHPEGQSDPQMIHRLSASRLGGIGILAGLAGGSGIQIAVGVETAHLVFLLALCALPAFASGLLEDLTARGWRYVRLFATLISPLFAGIILDSWIGRIDLDAGLMVALPSMFAVVFTCFAVSGLTNAFNLIDGINGLAAGVAGIICISIAFVAVQIGDTLVLAACLSVLGAVVGFMLWNFPGGRIHLGDSGAYLIGFSVAEISVLLVARNPEVSAWFPLLLCIYPVQETLFSIYRRSVLRRTHPMHADAIHLHHLIFKRLVRYPGDDRSALATNHRNSMTAPYLWLLTLITAFPAVIFWRNPTVLQGLAAVFVLIYAMAYARIARFRSPAWWISRPARGTGREPR